MTPTNSELAVKITEAADDLDNPVVQSLVEEIERLQADLLIVGGALSWCVGHLEGLHYPVTDRPFIQHALRTLNPRTRP